MLKNVDNSTKLFLTGVVFLLMILYILVTSISDRNGTDYSFVEKYINSMGDNYKMTITTDNKDITYSRDKDVESFESVDFKNNNYIKYNNKTYIYKNDSLKEIESSEDLEDRYNYDINLIKKVIGYCKYRNPFEGIAVCTIKSSDYNKELQSLYGVGRLSEEDVILSFYYRKNIVDRMVFDYTDKKYNINVTDIGNINYSGILEMIK